MKEKANTSLIAAAPDLLAAVRYQLDLNKWVGDADPADPFFEETLRLKLNTSNEWMTSAFNKATGKETP